MRYEGYVPEPGADEEKMFEGATAFARRRGTRTADGIFVKQFDHGTYAEFRDRMLWFEGWRVKEVREYLREHLTRERAQEREAEQHGSDTE